MLSPQIQSYLPASLTPEALIKAEGVIKNIQDVIRWRSALCIEYGGKTRLIVPTSLYLQEHTPWRSTQINDPKKGYPHKRIVENAGARQIVGFDAFQIVEKGSSVQDWRSFHVDRVDQILGISIDDIQQVFPDVSNHFITLVSETPPGYVRNWDHYRKTFLEQREGGNDMLG